jgi:hypothetical protein
MEETFTSNPIHAHKNISASGVSALTPSASQCLGYPQTGIEKSSPEDPLLLPDVDRGFSNG